MRAALDPDVGGALAAVLAHPLLYPLAALSYTGYLVSMITPAWAYLAVKHAGCGNGDYPCYWVFYALNLAMTLSLGFVLSVLVERPLMRWGQALSRKRSADPPLARAPSLAADGSAPSYGATGGEPTAEGEVRAVEPSQRTAYDRVKVALGLTTVLGMVVSISIGARGTQGGSLRVA